MQREHGRTRGSALRVPGACERAGAWDASCRGMGADRGVAEGAARARDTGQGLGRGGRDRWGRGSWPGRVRPPGRAGRARPSGQGLAARAGARGRGSPGHGRARRGAAGHGEGGRGGRPPGRGRTRGREARRGRARGRRSWARRRAGRGGRGPDGAHRGARDGVRGGRVGEEEGEGKEREREREGRGKLTFGDPNSGDLDSKP
jgi:translation initiation factor IF-2